MPSDKLEVRRGDKVVFWIVPGEWKKITGYTNRVFDVLSLSGFTVAGAIYDKDPENDTETITSLCSITCTANAPTLTGDTLEEAEDALDGYNLGPNEAEDYYAVECVIAAADTKHSVTAIDTALEAGYTPVWGVVATNGTNIITIGAGKVKFLPDRLRT